MKSVFYVFELLLCFHFILACGPGLYGDDCALPCPVNCLGKVCDVTDGTCGNCSDGWTGSYCDLSCPTGTYGRDCASVCKGYCKGGCNHVTGKCDSGCEPGWDIENCNVVCTKGRYGMDCKFKCGRCRDGMACHHVTGRCVSGCEPGFTGQNCNNDCPYGHYGDKCEKFCGEDARCNPVTGECCGCTDLKKLVSEKDETLDHKEEVVIGLSVPLGVSLIVNVILCLTTCYYYIIFKEECKGEKKGEQFLN
uniref:Scavenger receptor class F member 2-like n=1 Tax=Crassostrea virginica TaxID=6565 RepID=A0A8B8B1C4_CRAVI|nr:scavenger receptor class F member 2-like [Crassostrea virginica]